MIKRIGILTSSKTWTLPYCYSLKDSLENKGYDVSIVFSPEELDEPRDLVCLLSYNRIVPGAFLEKHKHNLVAHASDLPKGRGWSPLNWQILEGANEITITLFEAEETLDSGKIYLQEKMVLEGHELLDEMLDRLGILINNMVLHFLDEYEVVVKNARLQSGVPSFYEKRKPQHSELDIDKTLKEQFDLLRVVDNERYPAFFKYRGHKYILKIFKDRSV